MNWTPEKVLGLARSYQPAAVLAAAADLEVFDALASGPLTAPELAHQLGCDMRGLTVVLDALAALELLDKEGPQYALPQDIRACLTADGPQSVLAMAQHQANCMRRWGQIAQTAKTGHPAIRTPSVRGEAGDLQSFIGAMHNVSEAMADRVIQAVQPLEFQHLLDVGGASGTWTAAFLRACPSATATLFDLPDVIPMTRRRLDALGLGDRVRLAGGDFLKDTLPGGADLAWVSAIVHQNSREQNRHLLANVFQALVPGGRIAVRDILMEASRTRPVAGALFAVNMLVGTDSGGTFTFDELREDLESAGFVDARVARQDEAMNSILVAAKPAYGVTSNS